MSTSPTRGFGVLERWLACMRARKARSLFPEDIHRLVDIACGLPPLFLEGTKARERIGVDLRVTAVTTLQNGITLYPCDVEHEAFPISDASADAVTMLAIAEHLAPDQLQATLREARRILRHNGILIITTPAPRAAFVLRVLAMLHLVSPEEINDHATLYDRATLMQMFITAGFTAENIECGSFECGLNTWYRVRT